MTQPYRGSCLCGKVTFAVRELPPRTGQCHCTMCRKFHGAAVGTLATIDTANFAWLTGEDLLKRYVAPNGTIRTFCSECGSSLAFESGEPADAEIEIALGVFDDDLPIEIDAHIFTAYRANWEQIEDNLPRYSEGRGSPPVPG